VHDRIHAGFALVELMVATAIASERHSLYRLGACDH
jgi:prepilin-type N-terminal cleavage/methylation domain-containing protein